MEKRQVNEFELDKLAASVESESARLKTWKLPSAFYLLSFQLAFIAASFSCVVLYGYWSDTEFLYRPIALEPATNPVTAIWALFLSLSLLLPHQRKVFAFIKTTIVLGFSAIALWMLAHMTLNTQALPLGVIFDQYSVNPDGVLLRNALSVNTAVMLLMIGFAVFADIYGQRSLQQVIAYLAIAIPCISFIGYAYGLEVFYSYMSLYTAIIGFLLGWSALARTSNYGGFKAILSPYLGGRIARIQSISGMILPFSVGLFFVSLSNELNSSYVAVFVVFVTWFLVLMIAISAYVQEQIDSARREVTAKLVHAANTDPLTGLYNRRQFFYLGMKELRRAGRSGSAVAVLMIDIDDFKKINDTAGHNVGDQVLIAVSDALSSALREFDLICRFGGEEFCVLIANASRQGVESVCDKITSTIKVLEIDEWTKETGPVTVSIGVCFVEKQIDLGSALKMADAAMYQAKALGKNQTYYSSIFAGIECDRQ